MSPCLPSVELDMRSLYLLADRAARRIIVHEVRPGSPAESAGVRAGDALVALDGRSTAGMSLAAVRRLPRSESGRVVRLTLARDGTTREAALTLMRVV